MGCQTTLLDNMSDALWVELIFLDVMEIFFMYSRFMSIVDIFWFMVYAELFDQYVQYMSDTIDVCQKLQILSDTHFRRPIYDEVGGTSIGKSKVSDRAYRSFMFGGSCFSVMHDCDPARPCVNDTTDATCTMMLISSRRLHTNHTMTRHPSVAAGAPSRRSS